MAIFITKIENSLMAKLRALFPDEATDEAILVKAIEFRGPVEREGPVGFFTPIKVEDGEFIVLKVSD